MINLTSFIRKLCERLCVVIFIICLQILHKMFGIGGITIIIPFMPRPLVDRTLRKFGAQVGSTSVIHKVHIDNNLSGNYSNLKIGNNCYVGKNTFFDLVESVIIEDFCAISAEAMFLTHAGVGERPLNKYYPEKRGSIRVGRGSWIGARAIILPGVTIGECAVVGAGAVVTRDVSPYSVAVGVPAKVVKVINKRAGEKVQIT